MSGLHRARRHRVRLSAGPPLRARRATAGTRPSLHWRTLRTDEGADVRPRDRDRRRPASRRWSAGAPARRSRCRSTAAGAADGRAARARLHGSARPARRSRARRSTPPSSAAAPTRACPTCAAPPRCCTGARVAPGCRRSSCPASSAVRRAAEAEGLDRVFTDAGFEWRMSGCSLCFYAGGEGFAPGIARRLLHQPQFRGPPGSRHPHPYRQPRNRRRQRHRRRDRRPARACLALEAAHDRRSTRAAGRGIAAPLLRDNIDTDAIIPSREIKGVGKTGLADGLFAGWRYTQRPRARPRFRPQRSALRTRADPARRRQFRLRIEPRARGLGARTNMACARSSRPASPRSSRATASATASSRSHCRRTRSPRWPMHVTVDLLAQVVTSGGDRFALRHRPRGKGDARSKGSTRST